MPGHERAVDRGSRLGRRAVAEMGREAREARLTHALSQREVGRACGLSQSSVQRAEAGLATGMSVLDWARLLAVNGLDLSMRAFPGTSPVRDRAHTDLLDRLHARLPDGVSWATEVPLPNPGDPRSWDGMIRIERCRIAVEAETRPLDRQELLRRVLAKRRDGGIDVLLLLLSDTRHNRAFVQDHETHLRAAFPIPGEVALASLERGVPPPGDALILLGPRRPWEAAQR